MTNSIETYSIGQPIPDLLILLLCTMAISLLYFLIPVVVYAIGRKHVQEWSHLFTKPSLSRRTLIGLPLMLGGVALAFRFSVAGSFNTITITNSEWILVHSLTQQERRSPVHSITSIGIHQDEGRWVPDRQYHRVEIHTSEATYTSDRSRNQRKTQQIRTQLQQILDQIDS